MCKGCPHGGLLSGPAFTCDRLLKPQPNGDQLQIHLHDEIGHYCAMLMPLFARMQCCGLMFLGHRPVYQTQNCALNRTGLAQGFLLPLKKSGHLGSCTCHASYTHLHPNCPGALCNIAHLT
jgi:hypothetical protein